MTCLHRYHTQQTEILTHIVIDNVVDITETTYAELIEQLYQVPNFEYLFDKRDG